MKVVTTGNKKDRIVGLDIFRILAAFVVFMFHSSIHIGCEWGMLQPFVSQGALFMTGFFMLSGFALFMAYRNKNLCVISEMRRFYCKRFIAIYPLYWVVAILYIFFLGKESLSENLILLPIEFLGLQSTFTSLFGVTHNGGTWFVSCIVICYLLFPLILEIVKQINSKYILILLGLSYFILLYAPFVVLTFNTARIYENPFDRVIEFIIGVLLAAMLEYDSIKSRTTLLYKKGMLLVELFGLICGVSIAVFIGFHLGDYMLYSWIGLPVFTFMLITLSEYNISIKIKPIIIYLSSISYSFFVAQFFVWDIVKLIMGQCENNILKIGVCTVVCVLLATIMHEIIEKPTKNILSKIIFDKAISL